MIIAMTIETNTSQPGSEADNTAPGVSRVAFGGFLMGLANLVPGISGGTMILAVGLYERFIDTIANLTRVRLRRESILFALFLGFGGIIAVLGFSGIAVDLVRDHRWVMYSLFIGMTLGGIPLIWSFLKPFRAGVVLGFLAGFGLMLAQFLELFSTRLPDTTPWLALAGLLAATSMVLPGISGAYVLLILGLYETVIGSVSTLRTDIPGSLGVLVPVGVGAVLGIGGLSNLLKWLLARHSAPVHGVLLGLLVGSVFNLYPFENPLHPELADRNTRKAITALVQGDDVESIEERFDIWFDDTECSRIESAYGDMGPADIKMLGDKTVTYKPEMGQAVNAVLLLIAGFLITWLLGLTGKNKPNSTAG